MPAHFCKNLFYLIRCEDGVESDPNFFKNTAKGAVRKHIAARDERVENDIEGENDRDHFGGEAEITLINGEHNEDGASDDGCGCKPG